ncbi:NAD-dependent succinate-semialdehyde dehydrogenase [Mycolicibacterium smegmatis]|uniref:NAD-dependent succinate-semialdehyde dehydrogenase n=1 Tax=Mycolicibacterium smegmatis TaxID=1772 RepID=UPI0005D8A8F5|nr:NAD-dependent succinate-semialdehyde dehydrogenase [Mycolicibacterium smegmatis]MDF1898813.1 NAD-dependent succinate-semialdehyde dehydrogenase [Mycolicibacterium smegmatis]MDF1905921.1 NAD-dependent succinate-semialdehyde dehydrogenase [Mycolicibacterium smegmatis]MDF1917424.1 NAD-dependent succinate-semialdehyde dehydrogenase [Mycolicibacterium smegmatis]MDF1926428.1 NAD-dependent succinate-semialdehyde dehydrogenase [Mycolicibacterium smegmatis]UAK54537.1 NAD-dependent succinate-semialde
MTEHENRVVSGVQKRLFIDGKWVDATDGATFDVLDPATGEVLCAVADASPQDGRAALDAAVAAQPEFAALPPRERADMLTGAFELLHERIDDLALLMTLEMGKPLAEARGEITYAAEFFRHFAAEAVRIDGGYQTAPAGGSRFLIARQPVGPCLLITPWNFPMAMGTRKLGPAIAAGCTSVIKPAHQTPLSMLALMDILSEVGVPAGAVNCVTAMDAGGVMEPLVRSGLARKLSFTGSTKVGRMLLEQCAEKILRTSLELGGNAPLIVFEDADLDEAVEGAILAKMRNMGEACTAANRLFVHSSVIDEFGRRLAERMAEMPVGRGTEDGVRVGPLIDEAALQKVTSLVDDAVKRGATVLTGGSAPSGPGFFYPPTVLSGVPRDAEMVGQEIFGPVAPLTPFDTEEEAVAAANDTEYGLVSYVFTNDLRRALRVAEALETGMVGLNQGIVSNPAAPFGGIKESGLGREGGAVGIDEFLETKYVGIKM